MLFSEGEWAVSKVDSLLNLVTFTVAPQSFCEQVIHLARKKSGHFSGRNVACAQDKEYFLLAFDVTAHYKSWESGNE